MADATRAQTIAGVMMRNNVDAHNLILRVAGDETVIGPSPDSEGLLRCTVTVDDVDYVIGIVSTYEILFDRSADWCDGPVVMSVTLLREDRL